MHGALLQAVDAPTDARGDALFRSAHDFLRTAGNNTSHFQITNTDNRWLPTAPDRYDANGNDIYDYDYAVSCMKQHSIIEFINCRYSDGSAFNKNVFLKGTTDLSGGPDKVIINGTTYTDINEFTYW